VALKSVLDQIEEHHNNLLKVAQVLRETPVMIRLKATARAMTILQSKQSFSDDHKISWFNNCIRPALDLKSNLNYQYFDTKEIQMIKDIVDFNNPSQLNDQEAYAYLVLLNHGKVFKLDEASVHYSDK
jgi:hypothetical protein